MYIIYYNYYLHCDNLYLNYENHFGFNFGAHWRACPMFGPPVTSEALYIH
jgi:hypothetical protein